MKRVATWKPLALLCTLVIAGWAGRVEAQPNSSADLVEVELARSGVRPGEAFEAVVFLQVEEGWHINAHEPNLEYLIGTTLELEPHPGFTLAETRYPEPVLLKFDFAEEPLAVYEGEVPISLRLRAADEVALGRYALEGSLRIQACNDQICLAPATVDVSIPVLVVDQETTTHITGEAPSSTDASSSDVGAAVSLSENSIARMFAERGVLLAFLGIFVIGLALNLTPCVYPMLSVTVSLFGGQEEKRLGRSFRRASLYLLGIVTMYSVLGVAAAFTGGLFGSWLQSPWVLAGIGVLLLALALSMFGFYELQLPASLQTRLGAVHQATGPVGTYLSGLVVGIFAAPCIGPPILALLAFVGLQGDPLFGLAAFSVLALGLGLPYLVLGTFSGLLGRLPRSGVWMVWVKKVFGVVLVGAALFYLGLAFFPAYAVYAVPITLVLGGLYLGFLERSGKGSKFFRRLTWGIGLAALLLGGMAFQYLQKPGMEWQPFSEEVLLEAQAADRPVLLDFTADWCIPCLELDRVTFTDGDVIEATDSFVRIKVDLTHFDSPQAEALRQRFDVAGVPTLVFLDPEGKEISGTRVVGFIGPDPFVEHVRRVKATLAHRQAPPD